MKPNKKPKPAKAPDFSLQRSAFSVISQITSLIEAARQHVVSTANLTLVWLYWNVGRVITQDIQKNPKRADYGNRLLVALADKLTESYGRGFSRANLQDMRRFFEAFEICQPAASKSVDSEIAPPLAAKSVRPRICQTPSGESGGDDICQTASSKSSSPEMLQPMVAKSLAAQILSTPSGESNRLTIDLSKHHHLGWSHYRALLSLEAGFKRGFYFEQAASQRWSVRALQRQIDRALFERVALSRDTRALVRLEKESGPVETVRYEDAFKDPYLLDFLGLKGAYSEKDLEAAIIANLQQFLTELGSDFCFIRRQFPMRIDDDDYYLDLLFYHRGLRCLVAIDLKIGPFAAADKGQMDLYLSWLKQNEWRQDTENEPVGLVLCTSKKRQHVELLLSHGPHKMRVSEYLTQLPSKGVLEERLKLYSTLLDHEGGEE
jgi:predicted nuclease of restriction endonuclease-like (RecB) superfamily